MSIGFFRGLIIASASVLISACGSDSNNNNTRNTIPVISLPAVAFNAGENKEQCPNGGDSVASFADINRNGVKDENENTSVVYYCAGKLAFTQNYGVIVEVSEAPQTLSPLVERTLSLKFTLSQRPQTKLSFDYSAVEVSATNNSSAQAATAGEDFVAKSGSVVFERGETQKEISLTIKHDTQKEGHEIFLVKITNQVNTDLSDITVRINDDENPVMQFTEAESVLIESSSNNNTRQLVVTLSEKLSSDITIPFIVKSDKVADNFELAQHGVDYQVQIEGGSAFPVSATAKCNKDDTLEILSETKGCLTFAAGETQKTIDITAIDDDLAEGREKIDIQLQVVNGLSNGENISHILSIADAPMSIKAKFGSNCSLSQDGTFRCWGNNTYGHMGLAAGLPIGILPNTIKGNLAPITFKFDSKTETEKTPKLLDYNLGFLHTCAVFDNAKVKCWGYSASGQLGNDKTDTVSDLSVVLNSVSLAGDVKSLSLGVSHTCALLTTGKLKCWGDNQFGQLGLGDTANRGDGLIDNPNYNKDATLADDPKDSKGKTLECQVVSKRLYPLTCEGKTTEMGEQLTPVDLSIDSTPIKQLVTGAYHNCVLFSSGAVACWGQNQYGQLGIGDNLDVKKNIGDAAQEMGSKLQLVDLGTNKTAKAIGAGDRHTCALLNDDTVKCWGDNSFGQLGQGNTATLGDKANQMGDALAAIDLGDNFQVENLWVGGFHSCVTGILDGVVADKKVKCWGRNRYGQLGYEDTNNRGDNADEMGSKLNVLAFAVERMATSLALGQNHSCAILDNDQVKCWGVSDKGQLGMGDRESLSDGLALNPNYDSTKKVEDDHADGDCQPANRRIPVTCDSVTPELSNPNLVTEVF